MVSLPADFSAVVFLSGTEFLPDDLPLGLENIRQWALEAGLIWEAESQLLLGERLQNLAEYISQEDRLGLAIEIVKDEHGISYIEYPYLSVRSLIRRSEKIRLVYWRQRSTGRASESVLEGEVRFGFWISGCADEFCSVSTAKRVVEGFAKCFDRLSPTHAFKALADGSREIVVECQVTAKFESAGRSFDVTLAVESEQRERRPPNKGVT